MTWVDLADLAANLPPGCALWRATGGPMAWTDETHILAASLHRLEVLAWQRTGSPPKKSNYPKPYDPPPLAGEVRAKERAKESKRERYLERREQRRQRPRSE